ncbi:HNH endonuclease [Euzebya sp.]|uniref:HNH endonuclease n=1 Tax=Euzebya sp. TaxID=1971409 RepID=UPI00351697B4
MSALLTPPPTSPDIPGRIGPPAATCRRGAEPQKSLVLNASMEPLCVVPARRALVLTLTGKAEILHVGGTLYRSEHLEMSSPSVVRLRRYVRVPYRRRATLTRRGVFIRDGHTCQYCGRPAENIDHVHPRSRSGAHEWENVVAACMRCNSKKGDRTPGEAGMSLTRRPFAPKAAFWMVVAVGTVRPEWETYLGDVLTAA